MKQITNITILLMVLSIPFALSQTRKAIPAGRYEALSGVKTSHGVKGSEITLAKDTLGLFWTEVARHISQNNKIYNFYSSGEVDQNFKSLMISKGFLESKNFNAKVNILFSNDSIRDSGLFKKMKEKGSLIVLKEKKDMKDIIFRFPSHEILVFQSESDSNYYLLKLK